MLKKKIVAGKKAKKSPAKTKEKKHKKIQPAKKERTEKTSVLVRKKIKKSLPKKEAKNDLQVLENLPLIPLTKNTGIHTENETFVIKQEIEKKEKVEKQINQGKKERRERQILQTKQSSQVKNKKPLPEIFTPRKWRSRKYFLFQSILEKTKTFVTKVFEIAKTVVAKLSKIKYAKVPNLLFESFQGAKLAFIDHWFLLSKSGSENYFRLQMGDAPSETPRHSVSFYSFSELKRYQRKLRKYFSSFATVSAMALAIIFVVQIFGVSKIKGATYGWIQSSWTGGASTDSASHANNQAGWTKYESKTGLVANDSLILIRESN